MPLIVAATAAGAVAALYISRNSRDTDQHPHSAVTSVGAGILPLNSGGGGLQTRQVSYKRSTETSKPYGEEQRWARNGSVPGSWKSI